MNPIQLLKTGIETSDWLKVATAYESLTGNTIELPDNTNDSSILNQIRKLLDQKVTGRQEKVASKHKLVASTLKVSKTAGAKFKKSKVAAQEHVLDKIVDATQGGPSKMISGSVNLGKTKPLLPFNSLVNDADTAVAAELLKKKEPSPKRKPYKANNMTCSKCNGQFDANKAYPAGVVESYDKREYLCQECQTPSRR